MKDKKGVFLTKEFVGVVIAMLVLVLIVILGGRLIGSFLGADERNAQKTIDSIVGKIEALEDGENNSFLFRGVDGFYLTGWSKNEERPGKCFPDSCLCLSPEPTLTSCEEAGIHRVLDVDNVKVHSHLREFSANLGIDPDIERFVDCIHFSSVPTMGIEINKSDSSVDIFHEYGIIRVWKEDLKEITDSSDLRPCRPSQR